MISYPHLGRLEVEQAEGVTVARLSVNLAWDEEGARALGAELSRLAGRPGCRRLAVDLGRVEFLPSLLLGQLVALHKTARAAGCRLVLCALSAHAALVLERTRLHRVFTICRDEEEARRAARDAG
jgi:anti-anti-sigma factor